MWKRASNAFKDQYSLLVTSLAPRSALRDPDIEAAVVKATSHNDSRIDYHNTQRIFAWIRVSGDYIRPVLWALSNRLKRTRSSTVALKGLMLLHGVFACRVPAIQKIGQLPFDLSNFKDRYPDMRHHQQFIRAYYKYLQNKSLFMLDHLQQQEEGSIRSNRTKQKHNLSPMMQDLVWVEKLQALLDTLLQIKPTMNNLLVLEAMDCIVVEIFDIYSRICNGIATALIRIYTARKTEATKALSILQKAAVQGEDLSRYIDFCRDFGVIKAKECPKIRRIADEDIRQLEQMIKRSPDEPELIEDKDETEKEQVEEESKKTDEEKDSIKTIITDDWDKEEKRSNQDPKLISQVSPPIKKDAPDLIAF